MKYLFPLIIIIAFVLTGCKDFLNLDPISSASSDSFYKSQSDFENAIVGSYSLLRLGGVFNDDIQIIGDLRSDNTEMGTTASNRVYYARISNFEVSPDSPVLESVWNDNYEGIASANKILDNVDNLETPAVKGRITGEAKFLRGLFYFNLVRIFGDAPLVTKVLDSVEEAYEKGRTSQSEVYKQVISDLTDAKELLPDTPDQAGHATKGAAGALLGKVYLTNHEYDKAQNQLEDVIELNKYRLLDDFSDLWKVENKNNSEMIFSVQFQKSASSGTGSRFTERYFPYLYPNFEFYTTAGGYNIPTVDLIDTYEAGDLRKKATVKEYYIDAEGDTTSGLSGRYGYKFHDLPTEGEGSSDNWPVIRYADVLLMYAEVLNEINQGPTGEAYKAINSVRKRAGLDKLSGLSYESFFKSVQHERRVELAFEGQRWYDLIRTESAIEILSNKKTDIQDYMLLLPIPQSQIDVNPQNMEQNPGY